MKKYLFLLIFLSFNAIAQTGFTKSDWKNQLETEKFFNNLVDDARFKIHLKELTKKPHVADSNIISLMKMSKPLMISSRS